MILESLTISTTEFERRTGWTIRPEGACTGDVCVPLASDQPHSRTADTIDARVLADRLGMALVGDQSHQIWALGPPTISGRSLTTAAAPDIVLPDLNGDMVRIADLRPMRVVVVSWASW